MAWLSRLLSELAKQAGRGGGPHGNVLTSAGTRNTALGSAGAGTFAGRDPMSMEALEADRTLERFGLTQGALRPSAAPYERDMTTPPPEQDWMFPNTVEVAPPPILQDGGERSPGEVRLREMARESGLELSPNMYRTFREMAPEAGDSADFQRTLYEEMTGMAAPEGYTGFHRGQVGRIENVFSPEEHDVRMMEQIALLASLLREMEQGY